MRFRQNCCGHLQLLAAKGRPTNMVCSPYQIMLLFWCHCYAFYISWSILIHRRILNVFPAVPKQTEKNPSQQTAKYIRNQKSKGFGSTHMRELACRSQFDGVLKLSWLIYYNNDSSQSSSLILSCVWTAFVGNQHHVFENTPLWSIASTSLRFKKSHGSVETVCTCSIIFARQQLTSIPTDTRAYSPRTLMFQYYCVCHAGARVSFSHFTHGLLIHAFLQHEVVVVGGSGGDSATGVGGHALVRICMRMFW